MGVLTVPEYRWLLPAMLTIDPDLGDGRVRRSTRDWVVDVLCFLAGFVFAVATIGSILDPEAAESFTSYAPAPDWLIFADLVAGLVACVGLWWRRRWPVGLALILAPLGIFSAAAGLALLIVMFTVAVHRRFAIAASVNAVNFACGALFALVRKDTDSSYLAVVLWTLAIAVVVQLWGMVVRARRQLVVSLRDRVERAETEQQLRVMQAQVLERTRIAREMHDVLAHRISLLSLHAGALEVRPDAAPHEIAQAASVIRTSAHQALQDLREVIGVLRETADEAAPERPQPTLRDLSTLVEESRAAGVRVRLDLQISEVIWVPTGLGRAAYRVVQEGLTNARKHASGAAVTVTVAVTPGDGITIEIRNPCPVGGQLGGTAVPIPGTGTGLVGLTERATLVGGRLSSERTQNGDFVLNAWLPWPT